MAISYTHLQLLCRLKSMNFFAAPCSVLEIGEANVYGDFTHHAITHHLPEYTHADVADAAKNERLFELAKWIYRGVLNSTDTTAIDAGGPTAIKHDLNFPIDLKRRFDVVINHGTAEHVFNAPQVFLTMHQHCKLGGLIIHEGPFTGWIDHGFYCFQPTMYFDMAAANEYELLIIATEHLASGTCEIHENRESILEKRRRGELADNLMLWVAFRKTKDRPFALPAQGVYFGEVSNEAMHAWRELR